MAPLTDEQLQQRRERLGQKIREARKARGWSQDTLAHVMGIGRSYPNRIEKGVIDIRVSMAMRIADALEMPLSELFEDI